MIESERLYYIRNQQKSLRCETYQNILQLKNSGQTSVSHVGHRVILPSSFTGGSRYMTQNYLDAMSLCKWFGYPDFFITVTCNTKWPEIKRFLSDTSLKPEDRPDILCRLFKIKLDALMKDFKDKAIFGKVQAAVYTIEFQKRGLPHSHICLFIQREDKLHTVDQVDPFISAEIPNKQEDPVLYQLVSDLMIHGPCGSGVNSPKCIVGNKCSKKFPKKFCNQTSLDKYGFPQYRRRDTGCFVDKSNVRLDNRYVVPYNKYLLRRYQAHINVEWCNQAGSIKYLFKYINKGPDRTNVKFVPANEIDEKDDGIDEIKDYYDCRYISACEASWRIFSFDVHYRSPLVIRLPFHLPGEEQCVFGSEDDIENVLSNTSHSAAMFNEWMICNTKYKQARDLIYAEFPTRFVWKAKDKKWTPRKNGFSIGRMHSVPPTFRDAHYLRILLNKVKGPGSFEEIRTVNGTTYASFRDACYALGLLDDDSEFINGIKEASETASGHYLRSLFATMLLSNTLSRPEDVWNNTWVYLSEDIQYTQRLKLKSPDLVLTETQLKNLALCEIEYFLLRNYSSLTKFAPMPLPDSATLSSANNSLILEELAYDINQLKTESQQLIDSLTDEQKVVFDDIVYPIEHNLDALFFVYGYGGTGKTYLWKSLSSYIRSQGKIVINVASSGIASLLLPGGRTAQSRFRIPINLNEDSICTVTYGCDISSLLKNASLIIWDEAPMIHKHAFEALDRTLKDIMEPNCSTTYAKPFGGKVVVFGGDFRQILPVVAHGSRHDIVNASISSSFLWNHCKVLQLTQNMRLTFGKNNDEIEKTRDFANWLLEIGEGRVGGMNDGEAIIEIPKDLLIFDTYDPIGSLINFVYSSIIEHHNEDMYFQERAILAPKHEVVYEINDRLLSIFPGDERVYLSSDSICKSDDSKEEVNQELYPPDVLNVLNFSGIPTHKLVLKIGVPVMLLRNIDQQSGLCNGTRLKAVSLCKHVIEVVIISGSCIGERTFIPRMSLVPSDKTIPFKMKRRQFPLAVCFAMTINKSQGQSLSRVGLFLKEPVFTHGQLYVALSRVTSREGLRVLIQQKDGMLTNKTKNVVYKEVFSNL